MHVITLKISDSAFSKVKNSFEAFRQDELEIISIDHQFEANKTYLESELEEVDSGNAKLLTLEEAEHRLENVLTKIENRI